MFVNTQYVARPLPRMSTVIPASSEIELKPSPHGDPAEHGLCGNSQSGKYRMGGEYGDQPNSVVVSTSSDLLHYWASPGLPEYAVTPVRFNFLVTLELRRRG